MKLSLNLEKLPTRSNEGELNLLSPDSTRPQALEFVSLFARAPLIQPLLTELYPHSARDGGKDKPILIAKPSKKALRVQRVHIQLPNERTPASSNYAEHILAVKDRTQDETISGSVSPRRKAAERTTGSPGVLISRFEDAKTGVSLAPLGGSFPQRPLRKRTDSETMPIELLLSRHRSRTISTENVEQPLKADGGRSPSTEKSHRDNVPEDVDDLIGGDESWLFAAAAEKQGVLPPKKQLWDIPTASAKGSRKSPRADPSAMNFLVEPSFSSIQNSLLHVSTQRSVTGKSSSSSAEETSRRSPDADAPILLAPAPVPLFRQAPRPANGLTRINAADFALADSFPETSLPSSRIQVTIPSVARVHHLHQQGSVSSESAASISPRSHRVGESELQTLTSTSSTMPSLERAGSTDQEMGASFRQHVLGDDYFQRLKNLSSQKTEPGPQTLQSPSHLKLSSPKRVPVSTSEVSSSVSRTLQELIVPVAPTSHRPSPQRQYLHQRHQHKHRHQQQAHQHHGMAGVSSSAAASTFRGKSLRAPPLQLAPSSAQPPPLRHNRLIGRHSTEESASTMPKRTSVSDSLNGTQTAAVKGGLFEQNDFYELLQGSNDVSASFKLHISEEEAVQVEQKVVAPVRWGRPGEAQEGIVQSPGHALDPVAAAAIEAARRSADRTLLPHVLTPASALETYIHLLTPAEQTEILHFPRVYFLGHSAAVKVRTGGHPEVNGGYDYKDGLYITQPGDHLRFRYEILSTLGKGSFGQVYRCRDHKLGVDIAVKVIKNLPIFNDQAVKELFALKKLLHVDSDLPDLVTTATKFSEKQQAYSPKSAADTRHNHFMVQLVDSFEFRAHKCFVFPVFGKNLYEHMRDRDFAALPMSFVKSTARQLLSALVHLKSLNILHCDIKPENVLIRDEAAAGVVLIDFGSSCLSSEATFTYIQSRFYRSPEVLLGLPYGFDIDLWSVAAILPELRSSYPAFPGESGADQLACIAEVLGLPPVSMYERCTRKERYFTAEGVLQMFPSPRGTPRRPSSRTVEMITSARPRDADFVDFVQKCLQWAPESRMSLEQCLAHAWLCGPPASAVSAAPINTAVFSDDVADLHSATEDMEEQESLLR